MTKLHWILVGICGVLAVVGGPVTDVLAVSGAASVGMTTRRRKD